MVLNGVPVNLKGQQLLPGSEKYKALLGDLIQRELRQGVATGPCHQYIGKTLAQYDAAENNVKPQWIRGRSGNYTYYCVTTGLNALDVEFLRDTVTSAPRAVDTATVYVAPAGLNIGDSLGHTNTDINERKRNAMIYADSLCLKKRMLWLHGYSTVAHGSRGLGHLDSDMLATVPLKTSEPNSSQLRTGRYGTYSIGTDFGNNIINESLADGIPVLLEQEFNDGQVRTEVVTWLPVGHLCPPRHGSYPGHCRGQRSAAYWSGRECSFHLMGCMPPGQRGRGGSAGGSERGRAAGLGAPPSPEYVRISALQ